MQKKFNFSGIRKNNGSITRRAEMLSDGNAKRDYIAFVEIFFDVSF